MTTFFTPLGLDYLDLPPVYGPAVLVSEEVEWREPMTTADTQGPEVVYRYPEEGETLHAQDPVVLDVVDTTENLRRVILAVRLTSTGVEELVFDGDRFVGRYVEMSQRSVIENGYTFVLLRREGWPDNTTITARVWAEDSAGIVEDTPEE